VALFHALALQADAAQQALAPGQTVTLDDLRRFIDAVLSDGYSPVSLAELAETSSGWTRKHVLITFDDGYFNNAWALPVLQEFGVPATFFISTGHVRRSKAFWWDAAARSWRTQGACDDEIGTRLRRLKRLPPALMESRLAAQLGAQAFMPVSDADRPFTEAELKDFARSRWVELGNHTAEHTLLTRCTVREAEQAMAEGRRELESITGIRATAIAYPDGAFSPAIAAAAANTGHRLGFTCVPKSNELPLREGTSMVIGRHMIRSAQDYAGALRMWSARAVLPGTRLRTALRSALYCMER
jgi:peptidoglycan/xylan/chitin deacetylase (PgdA/CDA1 family)